MIYRTGVVGIGFIFCVGMLFVRLTLGFIRQKSYVGILLCSILVIWAVCANFLLTLEFPYTAVPVWSLYGMILAHYMELENTKEESTNELQG